MRAFFRSLVDFVQSNDFKIIVNATSGLRIWLLALYQACQEKRDVIERFFIFEKASGTPVDIWLSRPLKNTEENLLTILGQNEMNVSEIAREYDANRKNEQVLPIVSRYLKSLEKDGLLHVRKDGRLKFVKLSVAGRYFSDLTHAREIIESQLASEEKT